MAISGVKRKFPVAIFLASMAIATASYLLGDAYSLPAWSRMSIPAACFLPFLISPDGLRIPFHSAGWTSGFVLGVFTVVFSLCRRNWRLPLGLVSGCYLIFFWGWGLNYHRAPIEIRMGLKGVPKPSKQEFSQFLVAAASQSTGSGRKLPNSSPTGRIQRAWSVRRRPESVR